MTSAQELVATYGGFGLLVVSFVAATLVPFSSEVAVFAALRLGMAPVEVLLFASIGNCLGVLLNYGLGRWGGERFLAGRMKERSTQRAMEWGKRFGYGSLFLSWLPVVGDPLTMVAGIVRLPLLYVVVVGFGVRILRYAAIIWLV